MTYTVYELTETGLAAKMTIEADTKKEFEKAYRRDHRYDFYNHYKKGDRPYQINGFSYQEAPYLYEY